MTQTSAERLKRIEPVKKNSVTLAPQSEQSARIRSLFSLRKKQKYPCQLQDCEGERVKVGKSPPLGERAGSERLYVVEKVKSTLKKGGF